MRKSKKTKIGIYILVCMMIAILGTGCGGDSVDVMEYEDASISSNSGESSFDPVVSTTEEYYDAATDTTSDTAVDIEDEKIVDSTDSQINQEKLIYSCSIDIETLEFEESVESLKATIESMEGFIESENYNNTNYGWYSSDYTQEASQSAYYTLRVPSKNYQTFVDAVSELGNVTSKTSSVENLTSTYNDNELRLKTLSEKRDRLLGLMENATVDEMISIENSLENVVYEIDRITSAQSKIDLGVNYSYVNVSIEEVGEYTKITPVQQSFIERLVDAFKSSWEALVYLVQEAILLFARLSIVLIIPFIIFAIILVIIIKKLTSKDKKNTSENKPYTSSFKRKFDEAKKDTENDTSDIGDVKEE